MLFLIGMVLVAPALVRPIAVVFGAVVALIFARQGTGLLAQGNLTRQPTRGRRNRQRHHDRPGYDRRDGWVHHQRQHWLPGLPAAKGLELLAAARLDAPYGAAHRHQKPVKIPLSEGQSEGALEQPGRALALAPMDARNMNNRGVALVALGQTEAARADFERALRTMPSLAEARNRSLIVTP